MMLGVVQTGVLRAEVFPATAFSTTRKLVARAGFLLEQSRTDTSIRQPWGANK